MNFNSKDISAWMIFDFALNLLAWYCSEADMGWALSSDCSCGGTKSVGFASIPEHTFQIKVKIV